MTDKQKAGIIRFNSGLFTANETLETFGYAASQEPGADVLLTPCGAPDGYKYITIDRTTYVDIAKIFPSDILKLIASYSAQL